MAINTNHPNIGKSMFSPQVPVQAPNSLLKPAVVAPQRKPLESVTLGQTVPLRTPRPGSDMAQMLEDLQDNGMVPRAQTQAPESLPRQPLRHPTSDYMAQMVEDVKKDQSVGAGGYDVHVNQNGTIALLDESSFHAPSLGKEHTAHGHGHEHGNQGDALLGGHLGTEIIENVGHHAHHATTHAVAEGAGHGTAKAAAHAVGHAKAETVAHGVDFAQGLAETSHHSLKETANHATREAASVGKEVAHHLSTGMEVALGLGTVGAGILAVPLTINGVKELKAGIQEKDGEKIAEGIGGVAVGVRSAAAASVMAGMLTTSEVVTQIAGVAAQTLTPLGLVHAGIDTALGVKDVVKGKTTEGLLKIGFGVAVGAAAVGAGIPATIAAIGFLGAKVVHKVVQKNQEKKAAEAAANQAPPVDGFQVSQTAAVKESSAVPNSDFYSDYRGSET